MKRLAAIAALAWAGSLAAHEVRPELTTAPAAVLRLTYGDGQPFAFEAYELYPGTAQLPAQVGRTDAQGRVVFLPGDTAEWRLKAFSSDGHGIDQTIRPGTGAAGPVAGPAQDPAGTDRLTRILLGIALILGGFGLYQLFIKRRRQS